MNKGIFKPRCPMCNEELELVYNETVFQKYWKCKDFCEDRLINKDQIDKLVCNIGDRFK